MRLLQTRGIMALLVAALLTIAVSDSAFAQQREVRRTWGLSGSIQSGQTAILVPLWLGNTLVLAPGFSLDYEEGRSTNVGLIIIPRFYLKTGRIMPYIPVSVGLYFNNPAGGGGSTSHLYLGAGLGGEYFINPMFSFGVEARLEGSVMDLSGSKNVGLQTATAVIVNIYL